MQVKYDFGYTDKLKHRVELLPGAKPHKEPPRMMTSIASYPDHYAHAHTMAAGGYNPMMISSFNNPYYGYDTSAWPGYQDKQQMTKN